MKCSTLPLTVGLILIFAVSTMAQDRLDLKSADPETRRLFEDASRYFLVRDYKHAAPLYQAALDREKQNRTISQTMWRVMVDNLGMSYGVPGDLEKAKQIFEYGLSKDPKYPMFHFLMACTYAEMNDVDKTIEYLRQAFQYKDNMIKGENFPDPWTDDSFQRFLKNEKFVAALKEMSGK
jgi:tetratricopeptide (TPR) repeat protein